MNDKITMLIADDVEVNRKILQRTFEKEYHVLVAADGCEAMEILHKKNVDIVILDLGLPNQYCERVLRRMKSNTALKDIPVIVKTTGNLEAEARILAMGAEDFWFSSNDMEVIKYRMENIVRRCIREPETWKKQLIQREELKNKDVQHTLRKEGKYSGIHPLIIDDDAVSAGFIITGLRRLGILCEVADHAELAMQMLEDARAAGKPYDICLVNWSMNGKDGAAVVKKIRERFDKTQMLISCYYRENSGCEEEIEEAGADYMQERPILQAKLHGFMSTVNHDLAVLRESSGKRDVKIPLQMKKQDLKLN